MKSEAQRVKQSSGDSAAAPAKKVFTAKTLAPVENGPAERPFRVQAGFSEISFSSPALRLGVA